MDSPQHYFAITVGLFSCCILTSIIGAATGGASTQSTVVATKTTAKAVTNTATPAPPTATPTADQRVARITKAAIDGSFGRLSVDKQEAVWDESNGIATITITMKDQLDIPMLQRQVKVLAFDIQRTFWQSSFKANEVDIIFKGPVVDIYGNNSIGSYGYVYLTKDTAALFNWANLTQDTAWNVYDTSEVRQK